MGFAKLLTIAIICLFPAICYPRGGGGGKSNGHAGVSHSYGGKHTSSGGSATRSSYSSSSGVNSKHPVISSIDTVHENRSPSKNITADNYYKGVDKHGALHFSDTPSAASIKVPKTGHADNYRDSNGILRDGKTGRIYRSQSAKRDFQKQNPCPSTGKTSGSCPGYVIDHVQSLKHGGQDAPINMQWQTKAEAKAKDKWE